jgi:hypothetical protein
VYPQPHGFSSVLVGFSVLGMNLGPENGVQETLEAPPSRGVRNQGVRFCWAVFLRLRGLRGPFLGLRVWGSGLNKAQVSACVFLFFRVSKS